MVRYYATSMLEIYVPVAGQSTVLMSYGYIAPASFVCFMINKDYLGFDTVYEMDGISAVS